MAKAKQPQLDTFEDNEVQNHTVKFTGKPDTLFDPKLHGTPVAFLVIGKVKEIKHYQDDADRMTRGEVVEMLRGIEVPYGKGLELLDELEGKVEEEKGVQRLFEKIIDADDF